MDVEFRPLGLPPEFEPRVYCLRVAGGGVHQVAVLRHARGHAVVEDVAVLVQHEAVSAPADTESPEPRRVDAVEEYRGVGALDVDLAEGRRVEDRDAVAHREALAIDRLAHGFAGLRVVAGALPAAYVLPRGAVGLVPGVHGGVAFGVEHVAGISSRGRAEGHRRIGWAKHRRARSVDLLSQRVGQDRDAVDVAELALVGAETQRRIALHMLHGLIAFAGGKLYVRRGDIRLQVDELFRGPAHGLLVGHEVQCPGRRLGRLSRIRSGEGGLAIAKPGARRSQCTCGCAFLDAFPQRSFACDRAGAKTALSQGAGEECRRRTAPPWPGAGLGAEVQGGAPAAGLRDQVAFEPPRRAGQCVSLVVQRRDDGAANSGAPEGFDHPVAGDHVDAGFHRGLDQRALGMLPRIDDRNHFASNPLPVHGSLVGAVVGREQHQPVAGRHGVPVDIGGDRRCKHDARQVVVGEHQGALDGAGGQHGLARAYTVQALAGNPAVRRSQVIGAPLEDGEEVVVVVAAHGGAGQEGRVGAGREFGEGILHPVRAAPAAHGKRRPQKAAPKLLALVGDEDAGAGTGGFESGGETGGTRADHQHVAVVIHLVVDIGIPSARCFAKSGRTAQQAFPRHPQPGWLHEGLVVEPRGQEPAESANETLRAGTGRPCLEPVEEFHLGGPQVRGADRPVAEVQDGVGFFRTVSDDTARPRILETARDDIDAVREERGCQGVAGVALHGAAVEREVEHAAAIDSAAFGQAAWLCRHQGVVSSGASGSGTPAG